MKVFVFMLSCFVPVFALAAGGDPPAWLEYVLFPLIFAFPLTFLYIGYLVFKVEKHDTRRFVWMYVLALCLAVLAIVCLVNLLTNENSDWVGNILMTLVFVLPSYAAFVSYEINKATEGKYQKTLKFCWIAVLVSFAVFIILPLIVIFLPMLMDLLASAIR